MTWFRKLFLSEYNYIALQYNYVTGFSVTINVLFIKQTSIQSDLLSAGNPQMLFM